MTLEYVPATHELHEEVPVFWTSKVSNCTIERIPFQMRTHMVCSDSELLPVLLLLGRGLLRPVQNEEMVKNATNGENWRECGRDEAAERTDSVEV